MLLLAESNVITWGCMAILMVVSGMLLLRTQRYFAKQARNTLPMEEPELEPRRTPFERTPHSIPDESWEVEMHELARDLSGRLDSKMSALERLIEDADRAAARLEAALGGCSQGQASNQAERLRPASPPTAPEAASPAPEPGRYDEIYLLADYGHPPAEIAQRVKLPIGEVELILSLRKRR
jgi:hypothetical protein